MSDKEKCYELIDRLPEAQASNMLSVISAFVNALDDVIDDAYCQKLLDEAHNDPDQATDSFNDFVKGLGLHGTKL